MCIDAEVLQAMVDKEAMPVVATAEASELSRHDAARPRATMVSIDKWTPATTAAISASH